MRKWAREATSRFVPCVFFRHSASDILLDALVQMKADLLIQILIFSFTKLYAPLTVLEKHRILSGVE